MPSSSASMNPSQFNEIGSGTFFKEFIIPSGAEITLQSEIITPDGANYITNHQFIVHEHCLGKKLIFTPKAGKDYEALPAASTAQCNLTLVELK
ncbi:MAG: hypothetical protein HXM32_08550 [Haemophilus sp.]|nr:hypothetical protein [Haemophilus sp.]